MSDGPHVRVGGCRRTSTTHTENVLDKNFDIQVATSPPHKHGVMIDSPALLDRWDAYVFTVKEPFSWTQSMREWLRVTPAGGAAFRTFHPEDHIEASDLLSDLSDEAKDEVARLIQNAESARGWRMWTQGLNFLLLGNWGAKNQNYIDFRNRHESKVRIIRSEMWIEDPRGVLDYLKTFFDWEVSDPSGGYFDTNQHASPLPGEGPDSFDPSYYTDEKYIADLGDGMVEKIEERLQRPWLENVCRELGYLQEAPGWDW